MTFIETYSGYVLLYLLVGLACQLGFYVAHIRADLEGKLSTPFTDRSFGAAVLMFLVCPVIVAGLLIKGTAEIFWSGLKAYRGFFRSRSGTEELIFALFWLYMAGTVAFRMDESHRWWFVAICAVTALFLMQSARAMQKLKRNTAEAVGESPPVTVMNKWHAIRDQFGFLLAEERAERREKQHQQDLADIRRQGADIIALVNAHADAGSSLDRHRERLAVSYKTNPFRLNYRYRED